MSHAKISDTAELRRMLADELTQYCLNRAEPYAHDSSLVQAYNVFMETHYAPPSNKPYLVVLQCSVRRPYSNSPVHAPLRGAVTLATGHDPRYRRDFTQCPVHVVVMDSIAGPVPYEFEDLQPAIRGRKTVKHMDDWEYGIVRPILARRMARYLSEYSHTYQRVTAFCEGRYGEVLRDAMKESGVDFPVFPQQHGTRVVNQGALGRKAPRTYFRQYWIQLFLEVVGWLSVGQRAEALGRLKSTGVMYV